MKIVSMNVARFVVVMVVVGLFGCGGDPFSAALVVDDSGRGTDAGARPDVQASDAPGDGDAAVPRRDSGPDANLQLDAAGQEDATDAGVGSEAGDVGGGDDGDGGCIIIVHSNGVGQTYEDCQPLGTMDQTQALEACRASSSNCWTSQCGVSPVSAVGGTVGNSCVVWGYAGDPSAVGHVATSGPSQCTCPGSGDPTWN